MSWCVRVCSVHYSNRFDPNHSIICALLYKVANNPIRHQLPIITKGKDEKKKRHDDLLILIHIFTRKRKSQTTNKLGSLNAYFTRHLPLRSSNINSSIRLMV